MYEGKELPFVFSIIYGSIQRVLIPWRIGLLEKLIILPNSQIPHIL
jgi:hypothetical protein